MSFKRVYFIGAGFSAGLGYPVGNSLLVALVCRLKGIAGRRVTNSLRRTRQRREQAAIFLQLLGTFLERFVAKRIDLESADRRELETLFAGVSVAEFYSIANALADTPLLFSRNATDASLTLSVETPRGKRSATLYDVLSATTRTYFIDLSQSISRPPGFLRSLINSIDPRSDAIISFNWDEEVDINLTNRAGRIGDRYDVCYTLGSWTPKYRFLLLKPHGSIGWYDLKQGIGNKECYFVGDDDGRLSRDELKVINYYENELPVDIDRSPHSVYHCPPVIMPPTFVKRFTYSEQQRIWQDVLAVCTQAEEFVFLGYSLPADDYLTAAAIRSSLGDKTASQRKRVRCLVVTRPHPSAPASAPTKDPEVENYRRVFGPRLNRDANFANWEFGKTRGDLARMISKRLPHATT